MILLSHVSRFTSHATHKLRLIKKTSYDWKFSLSLFILLNLPARILSEGSKNLMTMKRNLISFCALFFLLQSASAQDDKPKPGGIEIRAGINMANISITGDGEVDDAKQTTSFHAGLIADMALVGNFLSFQPGILFTGKGSKTQAGDPSSLNYRKETFNPYYVEIPANLVVKLPIGGGNRIFVGAGPYLAVGIGGKTTTEGKLAGVSYTGESKIQFSDDDPTTLNQDEGAGFDVIRRFDYGFNGTVGLETRNRVNVGIHYGYGLAKLLSGTNSATDDSNKHRVLSFSVGIKL